MNEEHKKLRQAIEFLIKTFEEENCVRVLEVRLHRDGPSGNYKFYGIHIPVVPVDSF